MKQCPFCGYDLPDTARACSNCGRPQPESEIKKETVTIKEQFPEPTQPVQELPDPRQQVLQDAWQQPQDTWQQPQGSWQQQDPGRQSQDVWQQSQESWQQSRDAWQQPQNSWQQMPPAWQDPQAMRQGMSDPMARKYHSFAIAAFCLGILSIFLNGFFFLPSILALVFSIVSLVQMQKEPQRYAGKWLAIVALILSVVTLVVYGVVFAQVFSKVYQAVQDPETYQQLQEYLGL